MSNVIQFKHPVQNRYSFMDLRHINNRVWLLNFELQYKAYEGITIQEDDYSIKELKEIYKELRRRQHQGDMEAQSIIERWYPINDYARS